MNGTMEEKYKQSRKLVIKMMSARKDPRPTCDEILELKNFWSLSISELEECQEIENLNQVKDSIDERFHVLFIRLEHEKVLFSLENFYQNSKIFQFKFFSLQTINSLKESSKSFKIFLPTLLDLEEVDIKTPSSGNLTHNTPKKQKFETKYHSQDSQDNYIEDTNEINPCSAIPAQGTIENSSIEYQKKENLKGLLTLKRKKLSQGNNHMSRPVKRLKIQQLNQDKENIDQHTTNHKISSKLATRKSNIENGIKNFPSHDFKQEISRSGKVNFGAHKEGSRINKNSHEIKDETVSREVGNSYKNSKQIVETCDGTNNDIINEKSTVSIISKDKRYENKDFGSIQTVPPITQAVVKYKFGDKSNRNIEKLDEGFCASIEKKLMTENMM